MDSGVRTPRHNRPEGRPYRSHAHPACIPCRVRKSRCKTTQASASCFMCQANDTECVFPVTAERPPRTAPRPSKTYRGGKHSTTSSSTEVFQTQCLSSDSPTLFQDGLLLDNTPRSQQRPPTNQVTDYRELLSPVIDSVAESGEGSSHVVSPAIANDDKVFQEYLSNTPYGQNGRTVRFNPNSYNNLNGPTRPIVFNTIPKRGTREAESRALAVSKCAAIEEAIGPYRDDIISL